MITPRIPSNRADRSSWRRRLRACAALCAALMYCSAAVAQAASSTNYRMDQAVVGSFGGDGASSGYQTTNTGGEAFVGRSASSAQDVRAGYVPQLEHALTMSIDSASVSLTLIPGSPSATAQSTLTVHTDAPGYTLSVAQDHDLRHTDATTTIPSAGGTVATPAPWLEGTTEGLAFTLTSGTGLDSKWGVSPDFAYAALPNAATAIHSKSGYQATADATVVQYRVDVPANQKAGPYSSTVTYSAVVRV